MKDQFAEVKAADLNPGDVVHVSFKSEFREALYLNMTVAETNTYTGVVMEDGRYFLKEYSRYYLVEKANKPLPTKIGSVVKHPDGWLFVRIGDDNWKGIDRGDISPFKWSDAEVESDDWEEVA